MSVENHKIFPPLVFGTPAEGVTLELGMSAGITKLERRGYQVGKDI